MAQAQGVLESGDVELERSHVLLRGGGLGLPHGAQLGARALDDLALAEAAVAHLVHPKLGRQLAVHVHGAQRDAGIVRGVAERALPQEEEEVLAAPRVLRAAIGTGRARRA